MVSGVTSGYSLPTFFSQRQLAAIQYDHDHTPKGCLSCQLQTEEAASVSGSTPGQSSTKEDKSVGEVSATTSRSSANELSVEEKKEVEKLQKRDQEV